MNPYIIKIFSLKRFLSIPFIHLKKKSIKRKISESNQPVKIHLGCGSIKFDGWINIDAKKQKSVDVVWDLSHGIPVNDESSALIYCEHFLEHLSIEQGISLLKECYRVLQPKGILRIAMPSLDVLIEKSYLGTWQDQDWLTWPEYNFIKTRAEMLNVAFRWWGHQWLYDREELHRRLHDTGFKKIVDVEWGKSEIEDFLNRETRKDSFLICEAIK